MAPVIHWLQHPPHHLPDPHPRLWVMLAWSLMISGYPTRMALNLQGAQAVLQRSADTANMADTRDLRGQFAALQARAAVAKGDLATLHTAAAQALAVLPSDNPACRTAARCAQGEAHPFEGQRAAGKQAHEQLLSAGQCSGNFMFAVLASTALAGLQLSDKPLHLAAITHHDTLHVLVDPSHSVTSETPLGLARICCEWHDLDAAASHARRSSPLAAPMGSGAGLSADALHAPVQQLRQQGADATALQARAAVAAQTRSFASRVAEIASLQAQDWLRRGEHAAALALPQRQQPPVVTAMACLVQGDAAQALVLDALGQRDAALQLLQGALLLGEPGGFVRTFVDQGPAMARLVAKLAARGTLPDYTAQLLAAWALAAAPASGTHADAAPDAVTEAAAGVAAGAAAAAAQRLQLGLEPLSLRGLDILRLIQQGKSKQEVGQALFLSLHTLKWHNQTIFDKLQVKRRTEAVARARALNLPRP